MNLLLRCACVREVVMKEGDSVSVLEFLLEAHEFEGGSGDLLIHHKHEGRRQYSLQQLRLQTFIQTQQPMSPVAQRTKRFHQNNSAMLLES